MIRGLKISVGILSEVEVTLKYKTSGALGRLASLTPTKALPWID